MELLIMAAGLGSRFGGLKQLEPVGPNNECIIDYSIYDAIRIGCSKVIFIIKKENYELFKERISNHISKYIEVGYVFQDLLDVPSFVNVPDSRVKPWGTGHAIYSARNVIKEDFIVINADDFYGSESFKRIKEFKDNNPSLYGIVGYETLNTILSAGSVKRGILSINEDNTLKSINECLIEKTDNTIKAHTLLDNKEITINNQTLTSMNMVLLNPTIFKFIEDKMNDFFKNNLDNLDTCEFFLPDIITGANREGYNKVKVINTPSKWYGITYKDDIINVKNAINNMIKEGIYPKKLWK